MRSPGKEIKRSWFTAGSSRLWNTNGTYSPVAYERLPPLPFVDQEFQWLFSLPVRDYGCTLDSDDNKLQSLPAIERGLCELGFRLPEEFSTLVTRDDIYGRIPTCTACYLELSDVVVPLPGFPESCVVRFMNDSQCCVLWYLLFQPLAPVRVLANCYFIERDIFDAMEYLTDDDHSLNYADVVATACICAESFGEFIARFAIENMIWFATHDKSSLSPVEQAYLDQTQ